MIRMNIVTPAVFRPVAIAVAVGCMFVVPEKACADHGHPSGCDFGSTDCDSASCDSLATYWNQCQSNRARQRGSVGTLFRWSGCPAVAEVSQLDEPIVTDRPDFTEASSVVGLGILQLETGYTYTYNDDDGERTIGHSYPETLFRYGILANWLELRVAWNYGDEDVNGLGANGADDLYLGFKVGLTPQAGLRPEMALIPQMTVPTGGSSTTNDEVLPGLNWIYGWGINDCVSTAGSTQFNRAVDDGSGQNYTEWAQSWTFAYSLCDRWSAYTEYFGLFPTGADTARPENYFNGGFTYLVTDDMQWDIRGGVGLDGNADDYFFGTGLAIRFR